MHTSAHVHTLRSSKNISLTLKCIFRFSCDLPTQCISFLMMNSRFSAHAAEDGIGQATQQCILGSQSLGQAFPQMRTNQSQAGASFVYHHIYNRTTFFWLRLKLDKSDWHYSMCETMTTRIHSLLCIFFNPLPHVYILCFPLQVSMCVCVCVCWSLGG